MTKVFKLEILIPTSHDFTEEEIEAELAFMKKELPSDCMARISQIGVEDGTTFLQLKGMFDDAAWSEQAHQTYIEALDQGVDFD